MTKYQDNNQELVQRRNKKELDNLYPLLHISSKSRILDLACGIGRWADAIDIEEYCGVDFSEGLIELARKRNQKEFASFFCGSINNIGKV